MKEEDFESTLIRVLKETNAVDAETHKKHHLWISSELERRERADQRMEKFKMSIIGTIGVMVVSGAAWVGKIILDRLHMGGHP